jgi:hypothetical protein
VIFIAEPYREILARLATQPQQIFDDPGIKPWRTLKDRENCVWEITDRNQSIRLHVKRFAPMRGPSHAKLEADGYQLLKQRQIPAATTASWGDLTDGRSFIVTEDLAGFGPADKLVESGLAFDRILSSTADLAAALHNSGLHHRDLYMCHFMVRKDDIRLIDAMRVRELPGPLTRRRWIIKDLAQFWYSTTQLPVTDAQRDAWLARYVERTGISATNRLRQAIVRKSGWIAAHDRRLRIRQPGRNISIPKSAASSPSMP